MHERLGAQAGYADLRRRIVDAGLLEPRPVQSAVNAAIVLWLFVSAVTLAYIYPFVAVALPAAALLGFASVQVEMVGHDIGHHQVPLGRRWALLLGLLVGNLLLGMSYTMWIDKHNRHHAFPNDEARDPDGDYAVLALTKSQVRTRSRAMRPLLTYQAFLFPMWLLLQAFVMRISSVRRLLRRSGSGWELAVMSINLCWYGLLLTHLGPWLAVGFVLVHHGVMGLYNGLVFAPNHKGMRVAGEPENETFLFRQASTARNVRGSPFIDFCLGGLNYQIEHHLFPTMPRTRLKSAQTLVEASCKAYGISYTRVSAIESYVTLLQHLHRVSAPLRRRAPRQMKYYRTGLREADV